MKSLPPLQLKLLRDLLLIIIISTSLVILLAVFIGETSRKEFSEKIISQTSEKAAADFVSSLQTFNKGLQVLMKWGKGYLPTSVKAKTLATELLNARLIPLLEGIEIQNYFHVATSLGTEYMLFRKDDHWLTRSVNITDWGSRQKWQRLKLTGELAEEWWSETDYDPRVEPWYQQALTAETERTIWTEPYISESHQKPVISGAIHWQRSDDEMDYVVAFDITMNEIYNKVSQLKTTDNGLSFIATNDGRILLPKRNDNNSSSNQIERTLIPSSEVENPAIAKALSEWKRLSSSPTKPYSFRINGKGWWAGFKPLGNQESQLFWVGIAIPDADFIGDVSPHRTLLFTALTLVIIAGSLLTLFVVRRHSKNLQQARQTYDPEKLKEQLPELIAQGESYRQEFKSTMRHNLREGKPDKGIELAWLKTVVGFLNSEGGTLFIGIADDGAILGLEADNFSNEDKCRLHFKNLLNQHVGLEYSRYIHLDLVTHEEKQIAVVQCEKSQTPVFLKNKNDEEFYIRSGPSTTKLTGSKLLKYLDQRKPKPNN